MSREPDISVVMITVDRTPKPNYLRETIDNLERGGVFTSERLRSFTLVLGQPITEVSESYRYIDARSAFPMISAHQRLLPCENAGRALILGSKLAFSHTQGWVLFLEDDIDCCADFLGSVGRWSDRHENDNDALYALGSSHPSGHSSDIWRFPNARNFYGTQAIILRPSQALSLGTAISADWQSIRSQQMDPFLSGEYDLMIGHLVARQRLRSGISVSVPSFIQHIGVESALSDRKTCHTFPSWPGREWSYR